MAGSFVNGTVEVGSTVTSILEISSLNASLLLRNRGDVTVYLGSSTVTADTNSTGGVPINPGEMVSLTPQGNLDDTLYGVCESGSAYVSFVIQ